MRYDVTQIPVFLSNQTSNVQILRQMGCRYVNLIVIVSWFIGDIRQYVNYHFKVDRWHLHLRYVDNYEPQYRCCCSWSDWTHFHYNPSRPAESMCLTNLVRNRHLSLLQLPTWNTFYNTNSILPSFSVKVELLIRQFVCIQNRYCVMIKLNHVGKSFKGTRFV